MASQSGFTGMPFAVGELKGGVTGAQEEVPAWTKCKVGKPALLLVLAVPLPLPEDKPFNHGMREVPSLAPGYEDVGLTNAGVVHTSCICSTGGLVP